MPQAIGILAIDDDKISQKMIARALSDDDLRLRFADNGEAGLQAAFESAPDIILLDVEMPGLNGYEVCERLRENPDTQDVPVVFLSSHSSLRERMLGYEAGGDDYLTKPFEKEDLAAKIRVLARYREEQRLLKQQYELAQKTAYIAMTGSSELGIAMQFVEKSYAMTSYQELAESLLSTITQYQLHCALMITDGDVIEWHSLDEAIKPLEKEMLEMVDRSQRFVDFGQRSIINFQNLSLLVKNMPLEDMERYGRMKDLLPVLLAAVDAKINALRIELALVEQSEAQLRSFGRIRSHLYHLARTLIDNQNDSATLLREMMTELNAQLLGMGLDDDQEAWLLEHLDRAIEEASDRIDASGMLYHSFTDILSQLRGITAQQQALIDEYRAMMKPPEPLQAPEDDGVEFF